MTTPIETTTVLPIAAQKHERDLPPPFVAPARMAGSPVAKPGFRPPAGGERAILKKIMKINAAQVDLYKKIIHAKSMLKFLHSPHYKKVSNDIRAYVAQLEELEKAGHRTGGMDPGALTRLLGGL